MLYHRIDDADSALVRRAIVARGLKGRIDFQNVVTDAAEEFAARGGGRVPALWDGERLIEGRTEVLAALELIR